MTFSMPAWLEALPQEEREVARARFLIKLAALYNSPGGKVNTLSEDLGLATSSLVAYDNIPAPRAVQLEGLLGREHFPRELFRPDLFCVQE